MVTWLCVDAQYNDEGCDRPHASVSSAASCWMSFGINVKKHTATKPWKWMDMSTYHSAHFTQRETTNKAYPSHNNTNKHFWMHFICINEFTFRPIFDTFKQSHSSSIIKSNMCFISYLSKTALKINLYEFEFWNK